MMCLLNINKTSDEICNNDGLAITVRDGEKMADFTFLAASELNKHDDFVSNIRIVCFERMKCMKCFRYLTRERFST